MTVRAERVPIAGIALISAAALAYEILLTRWFAMVHWHSLVATTISLALLGFGVSGSFLSFFGDRLDRHYPAAFVLNAWLFAIAVPLCTGVAQRLPLDPAALLSDPSQAGLLGATFGLLAVPFFAAANAVGLSLSRYRGHIPRIYGGDLLGAAGGAALVTLCLSWLHPEQVIAGIGLAGLLAGLLAALRLRWNTRQVALAALAVAAVGFATMPRVERPAAYKDLARALDVRGAEITGELGGAAGLVTVVRNQTIPYRQAPGWSLNGAASLPPQSAVFVDGDIAGAISDTRAGAPASAYLGELISALPYRLLEDPDTLLLEPGIDWRAKQAAMLSKGAITAIEPNPQLIALGCEHYRAQLAPLCDPDRIRWLTQTARGFVAATKERFDLVSLVADADPGGMDALDLDFSLTGEAFSHYLDRLGPSGLLVVEGGNESPPTISMRMLASVHAALAARGADSVADHIAMLRGWQRYLLLASVGPLSGDQTGAIRAFADRGGFDLVWLPGLDAAETNRFQRLRRPLHHEAARGVLGQAGTPRGAATPASDDRPFPHRFSTWSTLWRALHDRQGPQARHLDMALLIGVATLLLALLASGLLILLPLAAGRGAAPSVRCGARIRVFLYFALLGCAFLFIEIAWIQRLQLFLDQPLYATAIVLTTFLLFAGLGSLWAQRHTAHRPRRVLARAVAGILGLGLAYLWALPPVFEHGAALAHPLRILIGVALIAPLAFAMGIPFPVGLQRCAQDWPRLIPWAWGINGCLSVVSAAAVPLLALEIGFGGLLGVALLAYASIPLLLPDAGPGDT